MKNTSLKKMALCISIIFTFVACSGGEGIEGSGANIEGTAATGAPVVGAVVTVKSNNGTAVTDMTTSAGKFNVDVTNLQGPFLMRVATGNGKNLYSVASESGVANIHPITDLIIRNWFKVQALDIDNQFDNSEGASSLPTVTQIEAIEREIQKIIELTLLEFSLPTSINLLTTPFEADNTGFDLYLDHIQIAIINNQITFVVKDPDTSIENEIIGGNVALDYDFTTIDGTDPSMPGNLRAIPESASEMIVVWDPSTDNVGVAGYRVFRDSVEIATTPYPVFSDSGLTVDTMYCYEIEAFDAATNTSAHAVTTVCPQTSGSVDTTAPPVPASVVATATSSSSIDLSWTQTIINDVAGFDIYRAASGTQPIATVTSTVWSDFGLLSSTQYCYTVVARDAADNESAASSPEACATTDAGTQTQPTGSSIIEFSATSYSVSESDAAVVVTVSRSGDPSSAISVDYSFSDGSATDEMDYLAMSGTLNWAAGDSAPKLLYLQIKADITTEGEETVNLLLSNASANTSLGTNSSSVVTISDAACTGTLDANVTVDTTISDACTLVMRYVRVNNAATLTISPGATLIFQSGAGLGVETDGTIVADGTAEQPILMTAQTKVPGYWAGIQFTFSNTLNVLDHVTIEYGGGTGGNGSANVVMYGSANQMQRLTMTNTTLKDSSGNGFEFNDGSILTPFSNNRVFNNENRPGSLPVNLLGVLDSGTDYSGNATDEIDVSGTYVDADQTWQNLNVPYSMGGHHIRSDVVIEAGTTMIFRSGGYLDISDGGSLLANGTPEEKILFTAEQAVAGYWYGLQYTFVNTINELDNVVVEYGGLSGAGGNGNANVVMYGTAVQPQRLSITNTILRNSIGYGFEFNDGSILTSFSNVTSTANDKGPGILPANLVNVLDRNSDYSGNTVDEVVTNGTYIDDANEWPAINVPYSTGGHPIRTDMAIDAGVTLIFRAGGFLTISDGGTLSAIGTVDAPILMTGAQATPGYWDGVQFTSSNSILNQFDYVTVEYGGIQINGQGNVILYGSQISPSQLTITNSTLQNSFSYGLWLHTDAIINPGYDTSNTFLNNADGNVFLQ